jgi:pimeloyl-ACP methyl ester carboxylesterase
MATRTRQRGAAATTATGSGATWRAEALGPSRRLELPQGTIRYHDTGEGPIVVFVHGALVNANLWRGVVAELSDTHRCIALDLPLGAHLDPMPADADISPPAVADLIADAIAALELDDVTLVGNDTGGALSQIVAARRPERLGALVLTSCDAFDNFPPKAMQPMMPVLKLPGVLTTMFQPLRLAAVRRRSMTLLRLTKRPVDQRAVDAYMLPALQQRAIRHDGWKLMRGLHKRHTLEAAERLRDFDRPAVLAWSREDKFFPPRHAERLAEILPQGRVEWVDDAYTFSPEDQPARVAEIVAAARP